MANPLYHDDPGFYERPGETVHLHVDVKPLVFTMPGWGKAVRVDLPVSGPSKACSTCRRIHREVGTLCPYCSRAQQADETHLARARQPQPSGPRLHTFREGWER